MSILGNNLLAQYYAQNQFKYIDNPELWIEADSWGKTVWKNKGNGGYDLVSQYSNTYGAVDGNAIISNSSVQFNMYANVNTIGTGSFTVEMVVNPSSAMLSTTYGGWIYNQRTLNVNQAHAMQIDFDKNQNGVVAAVLWKDDGTPLYPQYYSLLFIKDTIQYISIIYDYDNKIFYKQVNDTIVQKQDIDYSCKINNVTIGNMGWSPIAPFFGSLYSLRVYQRALSEAERANNIRRDKARFNF